MLPIRPLVVENPHRVLRACRERVLREDAPLLDIVVSFVAVKDHLNSQVAKAAADARPAAAVVDLEHVRVLEVLFRKNCGDARSPC